MIKSWIYYCLGLLGVLVFHVYYFGWFSWFVLQLMILLPLFSLLVSLPAMLCARLRLEVVDQCRQQEAIYAFVQTDGGILPLPQCRFRLRMRNCMTGDSTVFRQKVAGKDSWYVKVDTSHVGLVQCRAEKVRVFDYLKLFCIPVRSVAAVELLVKPSAVQPKELPNLSRFLVRNLRPKPGGGFSEEHEMRDYRPGDALRDIHWKLSAKTEKLIVREAQEPVRGKILLTLDLAGDCRQIDSILSQFLWMSTWLQEHDAAHQLIWIDPVSCREAAVQIGSEEDIDKALEQLLRSSLREGTPSIAQRRFPGVDWRYHIVCERGETA